MNSLQDIFSLKDKVIVVTGGLGLLGKQHCEAIAASSGIPVLLDLCQQKLDAYCHELYERYGVKAKGYKVNITDEEQVQVVSLAIKALFGRVDGLVNNAANNPKVEQSQDKNFSRLEFFPLETWQADINVGLTGAYLCAKYFGSMMAASDNGGVIVNVSSDLGVIAPDQRLYKNDDLPLEKQNVKPITYSVVKSGLLGLSRYLATYWATDGVRSNAICPGGVENGQPESFLKEVASRIPMSRMAKESEYQGTLIWMLSDASSYLNGAVISVDGGRTCW